MVPALTKLCQHIYIYHNVLSLVNANMSTFFKVYYTPERTDIINTTLTLLTREEQDKNLLDTPGCTIPNIWTEYRTVETTDCHNRCGMRAVFIEKLNDYNVIEYTIEEKQMKEYFGDNPYDCWSQFAYPSSWFSGIEFTESIPFQNGSQMMLEHEIIKVTCERQVNATEYYIYEDAYIIVRTLVEETTLSDENSWNVLLLGMDTMSRGRAIQSMPELVKYFGENGWLDYRAFQKAEANTFPNQMITYTGLYKENMLYNECKHSRYICNDFFIWSKFKSSGFVTAVAQDGLYHTFQYMLPHKPADHYPQPFFHLGTEARGNIECLKMRPCAYHILDYIYQFAKAYKDGKYFGCFWSSNYSHDPVNIPTLLQNQYIDLFKKLNDLGVLNNTIIFFYGDHGVRYGRLKIPTASYYDERLPMLYMWFPYSFRERFKDKYYNLQLNQNRLTTHSDLHSTLWNILKLSDDNVTITPPEYCPSCGSLWEEKPIHRSCEDMSVTARWCSCYVLNNVNSTDIAATLVPEILLYQLNKDDKPAFEIKKILRHNWFRHEHDLQDNITYYVIAIQVTQGDKQFEAVIKQHQFDYDIIGAVDDISPRPQIFDTSQC